MRAICFLTCTLDYIVLYMNVPSVFFDKKQIEEAVY